MHWSSVALALAVTAACSSTVDDAGSSTTTATSLPAAPSTTPVVPPPASDPPPAAVVPAAWSTFGFDAGNARFNPTETVIGPSSVAGLEVEWRIDELVGVASTPAVVDGIVYVGDWVGRVHAFSTADGTEVWSTQLEGSSVMSSVTVAGDAVFATTGSRLHRLDRATGAVEWVVATSDHPIAISPASPVVAGDLVLQAVASGELMVPTDEYSFRGSLAAYAAETGEEVWRLWLTENDETSGAGVGVWSTAAVDEALGLAFIGTGNTYEPPASPRSDAIVAVRYETGEVAWTTQFTSSDVWSMGFAGGLDADVGAGPNLWTADGRDLVGAGDKRGIYHALDRATGEVVWETEMTTGSVLGGVIGTSAHGDGRIYVGSNVGSGVGNSAAGTTEVLALDDATGEILWRREYPGAIYAPVSAVPGVVFVATTEAQMLALDAATGEELWSFEAPEQVGGGATILDGAVYWGFGFALFGGGSGVGGLLAFRPSDASSPSPPSSTPPSAVLTTAGEQDAGAQVYRLSCASCHGTEGQGAVGPALAGIAERMTYAEHLAKVRDGSPGTQMAAFAGILTDAEIEAVVAFERTLGG